MPDNIDEARPGKSPSKTVRKAGRDYFEKPILKVTFLKIGRAPQGGDDYIYKTEDAFTRFFGFDAPEAPRQALRNLRTEYGISNRRLRLFLQSGYVVLRDGVPIFANHTFNLLYASFLVLPLTMLLCTDMVLLARQTHLDIQFTEAYIGIFALPVAIFLIVRTLIWPSKLIIALKSRETTDLY